MRRSAMKFDFHTALDLRLDLRAQLHEAVVQRQDHLGRRVDGEFLALDLQHVRRLALVGDAVATQNDRVWGDGGELRYVVVVLDLHAKLRPVVDVAATALLLLLAASLDRGGLSSRLPPPGGDLDRRRRLVAGRLATVVRGGVR